MSAPLFELVTELQATIRRDFPLVAPAILNPFSTGTSTTTLPLVEGEWLEMGAGYSLQRGSSNGVAAVWPVHTEKGRYDTQGVQKTSVIFAGMYEAETQICPAAATIAGYTVGSALMVGDIANCFGGTRRGLITADTSAGRIIVGYVTKVTGSKLRFVHFANQYMSAAA